MTPPLSADDCVALEQEARTCTADRACTLVGTGLALLISGLAAGGTSVAAAKMGSSAAKKAGDLQSAATNQALDFTKHQDELDRAQYAEERARDWRLQDERQARLQPYRDFGLDGMNNIASLLRPNPGVSFKVPPPVAPNMGSAADLARPRG